ncbi:MAG: hypothetical protein QOH61_2375 [Chloroflexota bacterium]|nr:hypothetical protein [Chloroflexota bacterium]
MTAPFPRHLTLGSRGRDVRIVKRALAAALPHHTLSAAAIVGRGTLAAIDEYQEQHGIREDGYGLATHRALEQRFTPADHRALTELAAKYPAFPAQHRARVFATRYGGPRDREANGHHGYRDDDLVTHSDSYAELSTNTTNGGHNDHAALARLIGERLPLPYLTPIRVSYKGRAVVIFKRDVGFRGRGPDRARATSDDAVIALWWMLADRIEHDGWDWVDVEVGRH